jgi:hypothetical protein
MLKAGQEQGTIQFDVYDDIFSMVDYFARKFAGVADNNAQWAKLWGK